jgi:hypothetical protein
MKASVFEFHDADRELEREIQRAQKRLLDRWDRDSWERLAELLGKRSPEQIGRMERDLGLQ